MTLAVASEWLLERDRLCGGLYQPPDLAHTHTDGLGDLLGRRLTAQHLLELMGDAAQLADCIAQVYRQTDQSALLGDRPADSLTNPPGRIRREPIALGVI